MGNKKKHPPFSKMVHEALTSASDEDNGLNAKMILEYIKEKHEVEDDKMNLDLICHELERGKETSEFLQTKGSSVHGFFRLNVDYVPPEENQVKERPDYYNPPTPTQSCAPVEDLMARIKTKKKIDKRYIKPASRDEPTNVTKVNTNTRNLDHSNPFVMGLLTMIKSGKPKSAEMIDRLFQDPIICKFLSDEQDSSMDICDQLTEAQNRLESIETRLKLEATNIGDDNHIETSAFQKKNRTVSVNDDNSNTESNASRKKNRTVSANDDDKFFDCNSDYRNDFKPSDRQKPDNKQGSKSNSDKNSRKKFPTQLSGDRAIKPKVKATPSVEIAHNFNLSGTDQTTGNKDAHLVSGMSNDFDQLVGDNKQQTEDNQDTSFDLNPQYSNTASPDRPNITKARLFDPEVRTVLERGVIIQLVMRLRLQNQAFHEVPLLALYEIVHGTSHQRQALVESGAIPPILECVLMDQLARSNYALAILVRLCEERLDTCKQLLENNVEKKLLSLTFDQKFQESGSTELGLVQCSMSQLLLKLSDYLRDKDVSSSKFNDLMFVVLELVEVENEGVLVNLTQAIYQMSRHNSEYYSKFNMSREKLARLILLLDSVNVGIRFWVLGFFYGTVVGVSSQIKVLLDLGLVSKLVACLEHNKLVVPVLSCLDVVVYDCPESHTLICKNDVLPKVASFLDAANDKQRQGATKVLASLAQKMDDVQFGALLGGSLFERFKENVKEFRNLGENREEMESFDKFVLEYKRVNEGE